MVRTIQVERMKEVKKAVPKIEDKSSVKVAFGKNSVTIKGKEFDEFIVEKILGAIDFGFDFEDAMLLFDENFVLEFIEIKSITHRKNTKDVRARVIGKNGKAMKTIENLTESVLVLNGNTVGIIVLSENLDVTVQALESLIRGAKHGNVFAYLEKNKGMAGFSLNEDLGLTEKAKKLR